MVQGFSWVDQLVLHWTILTPVTRRCNEIPSHGTSPSGHKLSAIDHESVWYAGNSTLSRVESRVSWARVSLVLLFTTTFVDGVDVASSGFANFTIPKTLSQSAQKTIWLLRRGRQSNESIHYRMDRFTRKRSNYWPNFHGVIFSQRSISPKLRRNCQNIAHIVFGCLSSTRARYALLIHVYVRYLTNYLGCPKTSSSSHPPHAPTACSEAHQKPSSLLWPKVASMYVWSSFYQGMHWKAYLANMKTITSIYLNCRPDLRDEWLTGTEADDASDAQVHIFTALWLISIC